MDASQSVTRVFRLGFRYPRQIARLRVAIGIWLLVVTAGLYGSGHGGQWGWLLAGLAAVHFSLAYRLFRIARNDSDRHVAFR